jgi:hypothetical protein
MSIWYLAEESSYYRESEGKLTCQEEAKCDWCKE